MAFYRPTILVLEIFFYIKHILVYLSKNKGITAGYGKSMANKHFFLLLRFLPGDGQCVCRMEDEMFPTYGSVGNDFC